MNQSGMINAFYLKNIMLVLMVLDHLYVYLFPHELLFAHYLTRVVAPVFTFLMTQGMVFTRDRICYITRLLSFGALMALVNSILASITGISIRNNIFLSLGFSSMLIFSIDKLRELSGDESGKMNRLWILMPPIAFFASLYCEGGFLVPLMAVVFYYLRGNRPRMYAFFVFSTGLPFVVVYMLTGALQAQFYMIAAVFPIMLYNGGRGPDTPFAKYFFYFFYPAHVWIIVLIKYFIY